MAYCPNCGSNIDDDAVYCDSCGRSTARPKQMPPLDIGRPAIKKAHDRIESFPPLFEEQPLQEKQPGTQPQPQPVSPNKQQTPGNVSGYRAKGNNLRSFLLIAIIVLVIASAAAAAIYILLPELKGLHEAPVFYLSGGELYMIRGSQAEDACKVFDMTDQLSQAGDELKDAQKAAGALTQTFYYDTKNEVFYFMDLRSSLYSVKINNLGLGKKDIQSRVKFIAKDVCRYSETYGLMQTGYAVLPVTEQVFYLQKSGNQQSLFMYKDGDSKLLAKDAAAYLVSASGRSALLLRPNSADALITEYSMYICASDNESEIVKVDSRVSTVEKTDDEFELIWYTSHDRENSDGPVSVWIGGKSIDKERVISNLWTCGGFTDRGFYYSVRNIQHLNVWDYVEDVDVSDQTYSSFLTLRSVLKSTTFAYKSQILNFWSETGSTELARDVISWEVLDAPGSLLSMQKCDLTSIEKLNIVNIRSAYSALKQLERAVESGKNYFSFEGGAAFEGDGLTYCCMSQGGGELYMIDNGDKSGTLYSYTVSEYGIQNGTKLAGDVYAATYWAELGALIYVRDFNDSTMRGDLYMMKDGASVCISYDVYLPDWTLSLCDEGSTLLYLRDPIIREGEATSALYFYTNGASTSVAGNVTGYAASSSDRIFYLTGQLQEESALFIYNGEKSRIANDVSGVAAPGSERVLRLVNR